MAKPELQAQAIKLRTEQRLSFNEIQQKIAVSKGTLSRWLKTYPLTQEEKRDKHKAGQRQRQAPSVYLGNQTRASILAEGPSKFHQMTDLSRLSRLDKAKIAESAVMFRCTLFGMSVYGSPFDGDREDWIIKIPATGELKKLQVKWGKQGKRKRKLEGRPYFALTTTGHAGKTKRYQKGDFDFLVGYNLYTDTCFIYSWKETENHRVAITERDDAAEAWSKLLP